MSDLVITSPANARVKALSALRRRRVREAEGVTLVEGYDELRLAVEAGVRPRQLFTCPALMHDPDAQRGLVDEVVALGAESLRLSRPVFEKVAYREGPDGFLAVVPGVDRELAALELPARPLLLLAEGVEKPGNLGAMLRTAEAAGADAVIAVDPQTDWGNPNVVRASKGTVFAVPVASATLADTLAWLAEHEVQLVATTPDTTTAHTAVDLTGGVGIAVGTEKHGLTSGLLEAADARVRIPMHGKVNSLNVATSAAIVLYEAERQRTSEGGSRTPAAD